MFHCNWRLCTTTLPCLLLLGAAYGLWPQPRSAAAQSINSRCLHNACTTNCLAYYYFLAGRNNYHSWYDTAYNLTGCDAPAWRTAAELLLAVAVELVGAPGGYTMQCRQMVLGQLSVCARECSNYFITDCRYAPNVRTTITDCQQGSISAEVDNYRNAGKISEYQPNAYSRFNLYIWEHNITKGTYVDPHIDAYTNTHPYARSFRRRTRQVSIVKWNAILNIAD